MAFEANRSLALLDVLRQVAALGRVMDAQDQILLKRAKALAEDRESALIIGVALDPKSNSCGLPWKDIQVRDRYIR